MKRKLILPAALVLAVVAAAPLVAQSKELSIGISLTTLNEEGFADNQTLGFNVGYRFAKIFLADWTAISVPPGVVAGWTGQSIDGFYIPGIERPGFVNLFDVGIALNVGPVIGTAQAGMNYLYVYRQGDFGDYSGSFGANLRAGVGARFGFWSVLLNGTVAFPDLGTAFKTLVALGSEDTFLQKQAKQDFRSGLVLALSFNLYL